MRKTAIAVASLALATLGVVAPGTTAQAVQTGDTRIMGETCDYWYNVYSPWQGGVRVPDGKVRAWADTDCRGDYLGETAGDDADWGDASGGFQGSDNDRASSVMNNGKEDAYDVVAFYRLPGGSAAWAGGYNCLKRTELYDDNLTNDTFTTGENMNDRISSHAWVTEGGCSKFMS
ncbi:hypothetical protein [Kitasatospora griseola]|uniref:hypothetical protein n=1 Tax=Kitasatospora griseola TaxID=2064 RepID=UPI00381DD026